MRNFMDSWVLGYISGINGAMAMLHGRQIEARNSFFNTIVTEYCRKNPTETIADAALEIPNVIGRLGK